MKTNVTYEGIFGRNIGLVSEDEQAVLRDATVTVLGVGGLGGVVVELLARSGIGRLRIVDRDDFEVSNINRQIFAFTETVGKSKTQVTREFLKKINPEVQTETYETVTEANAAKVVDGSDVVVLAIDELAPCIAAARRARTLDIPLVEGWAIPFGNVRVIDRTTPDLEELYDLPTRDRRLSEISSRELQDLAMRALKKLGDSTGTADYYSPESREAMSSGRMPLRSFAPMVWLTSVLMATEAVKLLLGRGLVARGPRWAMYDPYEHRSLAEVNDAG